MNEQFVVAWKRPASSAKAQDEQHRMCNVKAHELGAVIAALLRDRMTLGQVHVSAEQPAWPPR